MTTPKELADKARHLGTYLSPINSDIYAEHQATIDQLQSMAEARQGSGEPAAWLTGVLGSAGVLTWGDAYVIADAIARVKDTSPPSAGDRTHIADLIDTFEQLRKIVGTPEQDADALIAAVRTLAAPPSAQQATGSSQVLPWVHVSERLPEWTDDNSLRVLVYTEGYDFGGQQVFDIPAADFHILDDDGEPGTEETRCASHWAYREDVIALATVTKTK